MSKKKSPKVQSSTFRLPAQGESSDQIFRAVRGDRDLNVRNYATRNSVRSSMFIVSRRVVTRELRQEFHVLATAELHFTPDGVSKPAALVTINIALLTEGGYCTLFGESFSRGIWTDFDEGFDESNLKYIRQFYLSYPIGHALRDQSSADEGSDPESPLAIRDALRHESFLGADRASDKPRKILHALRTELTWTHYRLPETSVI